MAFKKFVNWLKGANLNDIIFKIDIFTRKLDRQRKTLEKEAYVNRTKAKKYQMDGNTESSRLYAEHFVRYNKWAIGVDKYRLHIMNFNKFIIPLTYYEFINETETEPSSGGDG